MATENLLDTSVNSQSIALEVILTAWYDGICFIGES